MVIILPWILLILTLIFLGWTLFKKLKQIATIKKDISHLALDNARLSESLEDDEKKIRTNPQQLNMAKDDFVSIASHELRTPMAAIRSYAWMALYKSDMALSEKVKKYLVRILISTERLINLVNNLLNVSRIEADKIDISLEGIDLLSLAKDVADEVYYSKSADKNINITILEKPVPKVLADAERLREVMINLVGNSVKFTPSGGNITVDFFCDGKVVEVSIKDTGVGFTKEDSSRLFQKFGKLDESYVSISTSGGTGLGLYISKRLIEMMHGKIWARSDGLGKGATFTISLPVTE